ncbi:hypothetical protein [Nocardia sp. NPDC005998]|uniref:hypothetical protein n=1 Tax=Nocardia sp. NPDC005998 TaxID=3156894 RepID=UPI0033BBBD43
MTLSGWAPWLFDTYPIAPTDADAVFGNYVRGDSVHDTRQALTAGTVDLPGRTVLAGVWFRLLRILLDELSLATATLGQAGRRTIGRVWDAAGLHVRAGISVWRPYELLPWDTQEKLLAGAAAAIALAGEGRIIARETLGSLLAETPHEPVYDGDNHHVDSVEPVHDFAAAAKRRCALPRSSPVRPHRCSRCSPGTAPPRKRSPVTANC